MKKVTKNNSLKDEIFKDGIKVMYLENFSIEQIDSINRLINAMKNLTKWDLSTREKELMQDARFNMLFTTIIDFYRFRDKFSRIVEQKTVSVTEVSIQEIIYNNKELHESLDHALEILYKFSSTLPKTMQEIHNLLEDMENAQASFSLQASLDNDTYGDLYKFTPGAGQKIKKEGNANSPFEYCKILFSAHVIGVKDAINQLCLQTEQTKSQYAELKQRLDLIKGMLNIPKLELKNNISSFYWNADNTEKKACEKLFEQYKKPTEELQLLAEFINSRSGKMVKALQDSKYDKTTLQEFFSLKSIKEFVDICKQLASSLDEEIKSLIQKISFVEYILVISNEILATKQDDGLLPTTNNRQTNAHREEFKEFIKTKTIEFLKNNPKEIDYLLTSITSTITGVLNPESASLNDFQIKVIQEKILDLIKEIDPNVDVSFLEGLIQKSNVIKPIEKISHEQESQILIKEKVQESVEQDSIDVHSTEANQESQSVDKHLPKTEISKETSALLKLAHSIQEMLPKGNKWIDKLTKAIKLLKSEQNIEHINPQIKNILCFKKYTEEFLESLNPKKTLDKIVQFKIGNEVYKTSDKLALQEKEYSIVTRFSKNVYVAISKTLIDKTEKTMLSKLMTAVNGVKNIKITDKYCKIKIPGEDMRPATSTEHTDGKGNYLFVINDSYTHDGIKDLQDSIKGDLEVTEI
jgi:hypothetical protein